MNNKFLDYLKDRIKRPDYRGYHLSQHNRLPFEKVCFLLDTIYKIIKNKIIRIHVGDWKGNRQNCDEYYKIIEEINKSNKNFTVTVNSLKKNIFPDLSVMGFIDRFNKKNELLLGDKRREIYYIKLSDLAIKFVEAESLLSKYKIYINSVEKLVEPILEEIFIILYKEFDSVNIYEYTFILSDPHLNIDQKVELIKEYRKLSKIQQAGVLTDIQNSFYKINKNAKDKTEKRDFMNWYNESLQVFNLLNQTIYFKTFRKTILMLSISQEILEFIATRSQKEKELYFDYHNISKKDGYELHHIYPISYATSRKDLELIDNHKNMLYLSKKIHSKIPRNNTFVKIEYCESKLFLVDPNTNNKIDITNDCIINKERIFE
ncbi:MAG: hypothetical protein RMJ67_08865, partial [Elusimicrobiota bacterium]|nr:hypothetical protein [Endomicrobiia bacterium]MDW8166607.1 hypothetical protein [Elusimicrobiota bacterium]